MSDRYAQDLEDPAPFPDDEEREQFFCQFTFGQFFTLVVLFVISVCSSFYLGARYGNQYLRIADRELPTVPVPVSPQVVSAGVLPDRIQHDEELKEMARAALRRHEQRQLEQQANDYLSGGGAPGQPPAAAPVPAAPESASGLESPPPHPSPLPEPAMAARPQLPPEPLLPGEVPAPPVAPVAQLGGASGLPYSVQIGAYQDLAEASARVSEWKLRGYPVYLMEADVAGKGHWYRVRIGAFATRDEAGTFLSDLHEREAVGGIIVQNP